MRCEFLPLSVVTTYGPFGFRQTVHVLRADLGTLRLTGLDGENLLPSDYSGAKRKRLSKEMGGKVWQWSVFSVAKTR